MKSNSKKRLTSTFLSLIMTLSLLPTSAPGVLADAGEDKTLLAASADTGEDKTLLAVSTDTSEDKTLLAVSADTEDDKTSLAPIGPAFDVDSLLAWTAGSDEDGEYSRSVIPLAIRDTGFTVNDTANPEAKLMVCSLANSKHDTTSAQGTDSFSSYAFNYWQYATSFVYWSSSSRGNVVVPNGEFTDAAHTNGVPVMGTIFFDWNGDASLVQKFVSNYTAVADKLLALMDYYGFDGYFFNEETGVSSGVASQLNQMIAYMRSQAPDMLIGWYDSICDNGRLSYQDAVNNNNKGWVSAGVNEFFMNYNWTSQKVNTTISTMQGLGKSQYDAFAGLDVQQNCMQTTFQSSYLLNNNNKKLQLSLALYCPNSTQGLATDGANFHEVERQFYVNGGDPRSTASSGWQGMSRFFADHTTILSAPFVTNFNTGHGRAYYVDGEKSREGEWSYQSVQDVLPTWTWIIDSEGSKLSGGYDFEDAYNGGSSLCFSGSLSAGQPNQIMLYSTRLDIQEGTQISVTGKGDQGCMKLVAYYGDDDATTSYESCQTKEYDLNAGFDSWTTSTVSLADLSGQTLYAIGLKIESGIDLSDYKVNLGQLVISDAPADSVSVSNPVLEDILFKDAYTAEARLTWEGNAVSYEIYKVNADGSKNLIMETPNTAYYISDLTRDEDQQDGVVTVEILPVDDQGQRQTGQQLSIAWPYQNGDTERLREGVSVAENVCLGAEVTGYSVQNDGEPASKAIDGTSENGSKWCATDAQSGWMSIKLQKAATVYRWRVEHAEYGGEASNMNTISFELQYKSGNKWVTAKSITNNSSSVTDVTLDQPVTAQEWRLYINNSGSSPWGAIRIYEWQMFESPDRGSSQPVWMKFASAVNNPGGTDTFTLRKVPEGTTVKLYLREGDSYRQIGEQTGSDTVSFTDLDFGSGAGRVFYTTTSSGYGESIKLSTPFEAEEGGSQETEENLALNASVMRYNKYYLNYRETGPLKVFDGDKNTKWTVSGVNGWFAFDIGEAADIKTMKIYHAGSAGEDSSYNTVSYELYVLNERLITEEEFTNLRVVDQARICDVPRYWKKALVKTGNTENITEDQIALDHPRRYFKFNARTTNSIGYAYSVNIYEMELYTGSNETDS